MGISVSDEIQKTLSGSMFLLREKLRGVIFKIDDSKTIVIDQKFPRDNSWEDVVNALPEDEPRYLVFDFDFVKSDGMESRLIFVAWTSETAPIKQKMLYSGGKDLLKSYFHGFIPVGASDKLELNKQTITDILMR